MACRGNKLHSTIGFPERVATTPEPVVERCSKAEEPQSWGWRLPSAQRGAGGQARFGGAPLACAEPVCDPGGLGVPCVPVLGPRSPAAGGEHQGEESGQLCRRERVCEPPRAGARTRKPAERSESCREHERGVHGMGQGPGAGRMGADRQKGGRRGGEEEERQQPPRNNRHLASPRSSPRETGGAPHLYPPVRHPASL